MKIRIKGSSVRFRLTKSEVEQIKNKGFFTEITPFAHQSFQYTLMAKENIQNLEAEYLNNCITIYMPKSNAMEWFDIDTIGYQNDYIQENGTCISLLIEKDFVCLDETTEDQSDNYPHPLESSI